MTGFDQILNEFADAVDLNAVAVERALETLRKIQTAKLTHVRTFLSVPAAQPYMDELDRLGEELVNIVFETWPRMRLANKARLANQYADLDEGLTIQVSVQVERDDLPPWRISHD